MSGMAIPTKRKRRLIRIFVLLITLLIVLYVVTSRLDAFNSYDLVIPLEAGNESTEFADVKCVLPNVDPFRADIMKLVRKLPPIKCNGKKRYGTVEGQILRLNVDGIRKADLKYIRRPEGDDFNIKFSEAIHLDLTNADSGKMVEVKPTEDFFKLYLTKDNGGVETEFHNLVIANNDALSEAQPISKEIDDLGLNVAFVMLDSVSAAAFRRAMPKSLDFLNNQRDTIFFKGHAIVGDGTTAQLCAMFTGINEQDLPEARRSFSDSQPVDRWPFIFTDFKRKGYVTMFQEDDAKYATFNYRLHGFKQPPTDHYARHFYTAASNENHKSEAKCFGNWPIHRHVLSYATSFFDTYSKVKKFSLNIIARLPHNSVDLVQLMDDDLFNFMKYLQLKGHLDNTVLFVFGDHGPRTSGVRSTVAGKLEERLPFLSITLPPWFKNKHAGLYHAMQENANILTSHFDIYGTLRHILGYPNFERVGVGRSLFTLIDPDTRNCKDAGVADHWCPCLNYVNVSVGDETVRKASEAAVTFINRMLKSNIVAKDNCATLSLKEILRAGKTIHNWKMENFARTKGNSRCDSCLLLFKRNQEIPTVKFELVIKVSPSEGEFELNVSVKGDEILDVDSDISRINLYGNQPECIAKMYPHLRKYCFCK